MLSRCLLKLSVQPLSADTLDLMHAIDMSDDQPSLHGTPEALFKLKKYHRSNVFEFHVSLFKGARRAIDRVQRFFGHVDLY